MIGIWPAHNLPCGTGGQRWDAHGLCVAKNRTIRIQEEAHSTGAGEGAISRHTRLTQ